MVTLRSYPNSAEAELAKSLLSSHDIDCILADEGANTYGGAPLAMPIRLLVAENQAEEAGRILDDQGPGLPDDFDPGAEPKVVPSIEETNQRILAELRELRWRHAWSIALMLLLSALTAYMISELPSRSTSPWTEVSKAMRRYDYLTALSLTRAISAQHPADYYPHQYLGDIYLAMNDLGKAEAEYVRAFELAPPSALQAKINDVRKRRGTESTQPASSVSPEP
jgi:tetratricopeptide (TPR) repeat protein